MQPKTSRSSVGAEIYALSDTLAGARLLQWGMADINIKVPDKINIKVDNNQAKVFAENTCVNSKLRTAFSLKHTWVQELRDDNIVNIIKIPSEFNVSDLLTKPQSGRKVKQLIKLINPIRNFRRWTTKGGLPDKESPKKGPEDTKDKSEDLKPVPEQLAIN